MYSNKWLLTIDVEKATRNYENLENAQALHDLAIAYVDELKLIQEKIQTQLAYPNAWTGFFKSIARRFSTLAKAVLKDEKDMGWHDEDRFQKRFNKILEDLYNAADERVTGKDGICYKFIWVKTF